MELALQQAIDVHPVITFDVYDTLVFRVIYKDRDHMAFSRSNT